MNDNKDNLDEKNILNEETADKASTPEVESASKETNDEAETATVQTGGGENTDEISATEVEASDEATSTDDESEDKATSTDEKSEDKATSTDEKSEGNETSMESLEIDSQRLARGKTVKGKIITVTDDELIVNVDYKSDGIIPLKEINIEKDSKLSDIFKEDDEIEVEVIKVNDGEGNVLLSQKRVARKLIWLEIEKAFNDESEISGVGREVVKGGIIANVKGVTAFVPASQLSTNYVEDLSVYIGQDLRLKVLETDKRRNRIVASQKAILASEEKDKRELLWDSIEEGQKITGEVKRLTNFGAFVDIGGVDGLIHISDLSWGHIKNPKQVVSEGQEIEAIILSLDRDKNKISLGYKQTIPHPWDDVESKYPENSIVDGKVVRIVDFGAFVELEPGVDGLVHISQISHERVEKVEDVLKAGEAVKAKVLSVKPDEQRISLSIKETLEDNTPVYKEEGNSTNEEMTVSLGEFFPDRKE